MRQKKTLENIHVKCRILLRREKITIVYLDKKNDLYSTAIESYIFFYCIYNDTIEVADSNSQLNSLVIVVFN